MEYGAIIVLACMVVFVHGCSDLGFARRGKDDPDELKVHHSDTVILGMVNKVRDSKKIAGIKDVEVEVLCSYKGNINDRVIRITGFGNENGEMPDCPAVKTDFNDKERVIFFLKNRQVQKGAKYEVEFRPNRGDEMFIMEELTIVCGLDLSGIGADTAYCLPPVTEEEGCEPLTAGDYANETTTTTTPAPTPKPTEAAPADNNNNNGKPVVVETTKPTDDNNNNNNNSGDKHMYNTATEKPAKSSSNEEKADTTKDNGSSRSACASLVAILLSFTLAALV